MGGRLTFPGGGYYHATKYALEAISDALRFEVRGFGIDVILIEPGLIRTEFAQAAVASRRARSRRTGGPRGRLRAVQRQASRRSRTGAYEGPMRLLGGGPDVVAKAIEKAITAPPRTRIARARDRLCAASRSSSAGCSSTAPGTRRCAASTRSRR